MLNPFTNKNQSKKKKNIPYTTDHLQMVVVEKNVDLYITVTCYLQKNIGI